jgi:hypothetical protein
LRPPLVLVQLLVLARMSTLLVQVPLQEWQKGQLLARGFRTQRTGPLVQKQQQH